MSVGGPLQGIRVIEMARLLPGPYCGMLLADLGAEVIKVEDTDGGDYIRYFEPLCPDGNSAAFHALNRGKKSIMVNLKPGSPNREAFFKLLSTADVLLDTFRPGVMKKLGLDYESLHPIYPKLILCSITGYGQTGPLAKAAGHDINYVARAGVFDMMPPSTLSPLPVQVADLMGGSWPAALQIVAAIHGRAMTGKGCFIDVAMSTNIRSALILPVANKSIDNSHLTSKGTDILSGGIPAYGIYKTLDGHLAVGSLEPKFWEPFVVAIGLPDLAYLGHARGEEGEEVKRKLKAKLITQPTSYWLGILGGSSPGNVKGSSKPLDVCVEKILTLEEGAKDPQYVHMGGDLEVNVCAVDQRASRKPTERKEKGMSNRGECGGSESVCVKLPRPPLSMTYPGLRFSTERGPLIGEHNEEILQDGMRNSKRQPKEGDNNIEPERNLIPSKL